MDKTSNIWFRPINIDDLSLIMEWRISREIDSFMKTSPRLTIEIQRKWFVREIESGNEVRFMVIQNNIPIGNVYFNSIDYARSELNGPGWFIADKSRLNFRDVIDIYMNALSYAFNYIQVERIYAEIMRDNFGVRRITELCGMKLIRNNSSIVIKNKEIKKFDLFSISKVEFENSSIKFKELNFKA